jgi:hypothetical protein
MIEDNSDMIEETFELGEFMLRWMWGILNPIK